MVVRSVVKNGPAANSARPPVPGDTLLKVDGYDVRGIGLTELRPWIVGDEGSVVTLSFASANTRYDTSIVRVVSGSVASLDHMSSKWTNPYAKYADSVPEYERWRQDPLYNPAADGGREKNSYGEDNSYEYDAGPGFRVADHKTYTSSPLQYPKRASRSPDMSFLQHTPTTSWAMEADKILAEAQAKIEDALHRERLLQETLDMLREKNAVCFLCTATRSSCEGGPNTHWSLNQYTMAFGVAHKLAESNTLM